MNSGCVNGSDSESSVGAIDSRRWSWRQPCAQADEKEGKKRKNRWYINDYDYIHAECIWTYLHEYSENNNNNNPDLSRHWHNSGSLENKDAINKMHIVSTYIFRNSKKKFKKFTLTLLCPFGVPYNLSLDASKLNQAGNEDRSAWVVL